MSFDDAAGVVPDPPEPAEPSAAAEPAEQQPQRQFPTMYDWFDQWYSAVIARHLSGMKGKGRVFCPQWWDHREVVARLHDLWLAWEGDQVSEDPGAMSAWWIQGSDAHLRVLLDPEAGPMYRCSRERHETTPPLRSSLMAPPAGWFDCLD